MMKFLLTCLKVVCVTYVCVCLGACTLQRQMMYHPVSEIEPPLVYGLDGFTDVGLRDKDGTHVDSWYHVARDGYPTLIFFHGNGGNLSDRTDYFRALTDAGFGLLALDYRGYGRSEGSPSEEGFYQDARAAVEYVTQAQRVPLSRIVLYGESIGTGVAVQMATEFPAAAIVLQSPYTSTEAIAQMRYPWLPVHYLMEDKFDSLSKIAQVHAALLMFHGEQDTIIPVENGRALFAHANEPKQAVYFPGEGHNDLDVARRVQSLLAFGRKQGLIKDAGI